eukprot:TRINITY_DN8519_c0_g1_i1.p1 TRINITY_DN8519_c0_g1~~TRINITY_DN8519_c0_g1_i1.p1  ORF type:complete len:153 (-),score=31.68 TRINITY_DN8519_c0_g1_i1:26-457(-)
MASAYPEAPADKDYIRQNNLPLLFDSLLRGMLQQRPKDPLAFLNNRIAELRATKSATGAELSDVLRRRIDLRTRQELAAGTIQAFMRRCKRHHERKERRAIERRLEMIVLVQSVIRAFLARVRCRRLRLGHAGDNGKSTNNQQ